MYSTLLAASALERGGYLIEGDIICSDAAVDRLIGAGADGSSWAASPWTSGHTGSRLRADADGRIVAQEIRRAPTPGSPGLWKSAGMLKLDARGASALLGRLREEADAGNRGLYYDDVVGRHVDRFELRILDLSGAPWAEIDDLRDLAAARELFEAAPDARGA
jgi:hypothetical protein